MEPDEDPVVEASQESDTSGWCPYCGDDGLDDRQEHIEREHMSVQI